MNWSKKKKRPCSGAEKWKDLFQPWQTMPYQENWTAGKMHVAWFIWGKTRIKHICTVHWNKWGFTLYRENQYNNRLCAQCTLCACLISAWILHCYTKDTACKVTHYDIRNLFLPLFKLQSQTSHLGFGLKSGVLSTNTTVQKRLMLKESSWDTHPPP